MTRVLIIGIDGATLDLVQPWAEAGHLPNLHRLMREGSYGPLRSVLPVLSSAAWASFMTGTNPGKHGVFDFVRRDPQSYALRAVRGDQIQGETLWHMLSRLGRSVGVMNVPMTYPPEPVNGFLVSGLGTPDDRNFTFPPELAGELRREGHCLNLRTPYRPGRERAVLDEMSACTERLGRSALRLLERHSPDLFMVLFRETDEAAHFFWRHMDATHPLHDPQRDAPFAMAIRDLYTQIDTIVGRLVQAAGPQATVFVVSDHGSGPLYKDVFINEWLRQNGLFSVRDKPRSAASAAGLAARLGLTREGISLALRRLGLHSLERTIRRLMGARLERIPRSTRMQFPEGIDWARTSAYSFGYHGQIYVNLKGREPEGIVEPGSAYQDVLARLERGLHELTDPDDGLPVVTRIVRREDAFHGPMTEAAPDLIVVMRNLAYITRHGYEYATHSGRVFDSPHIHQSGSHRLEGMLVVAGANTRAGGLISQGADLADVAPTTLQILGCHVPAGMDGHPLDDWIKPTSPVDIREEITLPSQPGVAGSDWAAADEQAVLKRLRDLGYLE
jgi:predicted AlkP superfamily phosphohydrolase/phosphomutase